MRNIKTAIIAIMSVLSVLLVACGSDSGTGLDSDETSEAKTVYGLGDCKGANEGVTKFVTSEDQYYKCVDGDWKRIESPAKPSTSKASSSSIQRTESSNSSTHRAESSSSSFSLSVDIVQGVMVDSRDGKEYLTVTIGEQTWMAENLDFDYQVDGVSYGHSYVESLTVNNPNGTRENVYSGRRYTIGAAIDSAAIYSESGKGCGKETHCLTMCDSEGICSLGENVRGICPEGWHLPSNADWLTLIDAVGGKTIAPLVLISEKWGLNNMIDAAGFHVNPNECFTDIDSLICSVGFWSATGFIYSAELLEAIADAGLSYDLYNRDHFYWFGISSSNVYKGNTTSYSVDFYYFEDNHYSQSVRCIKNK